MEGNFPTLQKRRRRSTKLPSAMCNPFSKEEILKSHQCLQKGGGSKGQRHAPALGLLLSRQHSSLGACQGFGCLTSLWVRWGFRPLCLLKSVPKLLSSGLLCRLLSVNEPEEEEVVVEEEGTEWEENSCNCTAHKEQAAEGRHSVCSSSASLWFTDGC